MKEALSLQGLCTQVTETATVVEGVERLSQDSFDCLFFDGGSCEPEDFRALQEIRDVAPTLPVIVLIAPGCHHAITQFWKMGASDCIVATETSPDRLSCHVRGLVRLHRAQQAWHKAQERMARNRRRMLELQKQLRHQAEAAILAKDRFLSVLSHELRTPLTPVLTLVEALRKEENLPLQAKEAMEIIGRNVELEARLIDDLIDLTRSHKGTLRLNRHAVDAHALLRHASEICRGEAVEKGLHWTMKLYAWDHHVDADSARLQQVFWNLFRNAVKFTPPGGSVEVRTRNDGQCGQAQAEPSPAARPQMLVVEIIDSGVGIDSESMLRIFSAFEQGHGAALTRAGGIGLGLAISKALIEAHDGHLEAFSDGRDKGAMFRVTLAASGLDRPVRPSTARETCSVAPAPSLRHSILLVDDHLDTSRAMQRLLQKMGYCVETAHSVQAALHAAATAAAARRKFDLLISDIGLPDGTGLELMRQIRAIQEIEGIALSGYGMEEDIRRSKEAGFRDHLTKPVNIQKLQGLIHEVVGKR